MKHSYLFLTLTFSALSASSYSAPSLADVYLSRDLCSVDYSSLYKHSGQQKIIMNRAERYAALKTITSASDEACLDAVLYRFSRDYQESADRRAKPYLDNCSGLPKKFYADKNGKVIYKLTDRKMGQIEETMLSNNNISTCMAPFITW